MHENDRILNLRDGRVPGTPNDTGVSFKCPLCRIFRMEMDKFEVTCKVTTGALTISVLEYTGMVYSPWRSTVNLKQI